MILQRKKIKVNKANSSDDSLRIGVPKKFAEVLNIQAGDSVEWQLHYVDNGLFITIIKSE